jgi:hypothetical protein
MGVTIKKTVEINLSADEWELYTVSMDCTEAAAELNKAMTEAINTSDTAAEAYRKSEGTFSKLANFGASDSEPLYHMNSILHKVYGDEWVI